MVRKIYCHFDGYLTHNGALLLDHYNSPEKVKELIDVGDISVLAKNLNPDPTRKHGFDYYDSEIISAVAKNNGLDKEYVELNLSNHGWQNVPISFRGTIGSTAYIQSSKIQLLIEQKRVIEAIAAIALYDIV